MKLPKYLNGDAPRFVKWASWLIILATACTIIGGWVGIVSAHFTNWVVRDEAQRRAEGDKLIIQMVNAQGEAATTKIDLMARALILPPSDPARAQLLQEVRYVEPVPQPVSLPPGAQAKDGH